MPIPWKTIGPAVFLISVALAAIAVFIQVAELDTRRLRIVPLGEIYSTSGQGGLKQISGAYHGEGDQRKFVHPGGSYLDQMNRGGGFDGASDAFLVDAIGIQDAIAASSSVLLGGWAASPTATVNTSNPPRGSHWLVAYLGIGASGPTWWEVESVTVDRRHIRLAYTLPTHHTATADIHRYYYWAPLGKLEPGVYSVELYDAALEALTMMRRVEVPAAKPRR